MPTIKVNNVEIYYEESGAGKPLIFISGLCGDSSSWVADTQFYGKYFRCILVDNRGINAPRPPARPPKGTFGIKDMADDISKLMTKLKIEKTHLIGHSMGGAIAQEIAINHPEQVEKMILVSSWAKSNIQTRRLFEVFREMNRECEPALFIRNLTQWVFGRDFFERNMEVILVAEQIRITDPFPVDIIETQCNACIGHDTLSRLSLIQAITLVTAGSEDILLPRYYSEELAANIPDARLAVFEGGGHIHLWEKPEEFHERTIEFLLNE